MATQHSRPQLTEQCDLNGVGVATLALLVEEPMHPYQVFQTLEKRQDTRLVRATPGAVYHSMERLDRDGLVEKVSTERQGRRPERTVYRITEAGRRVLATHVRLFLAEDLPSFPLFVIGLAEAHVLDQSEIMTALTTRRDRQRAELTALNDTHARLRAGGLPRRFLLEVAYEAHQLAAEVNWLDGVLADLTSGDLDWSDEKPETLALQGDRPPIPPALPITPNH